MIAIFCIIGAVVTICLIAFWAHLNTLKSRQREYKDWEIDDLIIVNPHYMGHITFSNGKQLAKVKGWNEYDIYLNFGDNQVHKFDWDIFKSNKSALWRRNYKECEKAMGKKPGFSGGCSDSGIKGGRKINGKPIELLNETECQVYLTEAIVDEDYELAELIRKRLEKFR